MPISYECPYCGTKTLVDDQFAGKSGPCATCGKLVTIPFHIDGTSEGDDAKPQTAAKQAARTGSSILMIALVLLGGMLVVGAMSIMLFVFIAPAVQEANIATMNMETTSNLQQIASAMHQYAQDHGTYPPAFIPDSAGQPMHSWRVLILPYLGHRNLYEQYDFDQPWDSLQNKDLMYQMPPVYACEADPDASMFYNTSYLVVAGDETMFPGGKGRKPGELVDALQDTVLVVESHDSGIMWMEPRDLQFSQMSLMINGTKAQDIRSESPDGGAHVITADDMTHKLDESVAQEDVRGMLTIDGGEVIPWEEIDNE